MSTGRAMKALNYTLSCMMALVATMPICEAAPEKCTTTTSKGSLASANPQNRSYLKVTLVRETCANGCITGTLTIPTKGGTNWTCKTLELPNQDNKKGVSCIPGERTYICQRVDSPKFGDTFEITEVPGERDHILFHAGNKPSNTSGCVLLGMKIDPKTNFITGGTSRPAVESFLRELEGYKSFLLTIEDKTKTCPNLPPRPVASR